MNTFENLVDAALAIEKLRVQSEVRQTHLSKQGKQDLETDELHRRLKDLEKWVDGRIGEMLSAHPAYPWFSRVKGIGKENIAKVVGLVRIAPEMNEDGKELPYARTISGLWSFAGYSVEDGKAPKRTKGEKLAYNSQLRSMCYDDQTEVLTENGFKLWNDVSHSDRLATLNIETGFLEYQLPSKLHSYFFDGRLVSFRGQSIDMRVTPDHSMLIRKTGDSWHLVTADEILQGYYANKALRVRSTKRKLALERNKELVAVGVSYGYRLAQVAAEQGLSIGMANHYIGSAVPAKGLAPILLEFKRDALWQGTDNCTHPAGNIATWVTFLGWYLSEGTSRCSPSGYQVTIHQCNEVNKKEVAAVIEQLGFIPRVYSDRVCFSNKAVATYLQQFGHASEKYIPSEVKNLNPSYLHLLIDSLIKGDGTIQGKAKVYMTTSKCLADDVCEIGLKSGFAVTICVREPRPVEKRKSKLPLYTVIMGTQKTPRVPAPVLEYYTGQVYCATVPNHTLFVRRNGKMAWSGNCWRVGSSLLKAQGKFYDFYALQKDQYLLKFEQQGIKVMPTPSGQWCCANCGESWKRKGDIAKCCDEQFITKKMREEPAGVIWQGHLHNMALRKMIKLFLSCLWLTWQEGLGLPVSKPYAFEQLNHQHYICPWDLVDR